MNRRIGLAALMLASVMFTGCGGHKATQARVPEAPSVETEQARVEPPSRAIPDAAKPSTREESDLEERYRDATPIYSETGMASWYGTVYHHRKAANGEIYDQNGITAAHRTLPLNSIARVTNLKDGRSVIVRITDRGPFVGNRVIDLSVGAAKAIDVWRAGTAKVRIDVLASPKEIASGGRWCVQIGAFDSVQEAAELKQRLAHKYQTARVLQFTGPTGEWLRVRVAQDDKAKAYEVAKNTHTDGPGVYVVRLD